MVIGVVVKDARTFGELVVPLVSGSLPAAALALGVADKTIKRHLKALREQGRIQRVGSDKAGHWDIIERPL